MKKINLVLILCGIILLFTGCKQYYSLHNYEPNLDLTFPNEIETQTHEVGGQPTQPSTQPSIEPTQSVQSTETTAQTTKPIESATKPSEPTEQSTQPTELATQPVKPTEPFTEQPTVPTDDRLLIAIDAGHQGKSNRDKEPLGPGSTEMKTKVAAGTQGCVTKIPEYQLTLEIALQLETELRARGYEVLMIRTSHDVNISNAERAEIANKAGADVFIRIHANGSEKPEVNGAMTLCQTPGNPYNGALYTQSRLLSDCVLDAFVTSTGCKKQYVWETDTMSGINWCQVPVTIIEMGYMSNPQEDELMATPEYQKKMVQGIANGIGAYMLKR